MVPQMYQNNDQKIQNENLPNQINIEQQQDGTNYRDYLFNNLPNNYYYCYQNNKNFDEQQIPQIPQSLPTAPFEQNSFPCENYYEGYFPEQHIPPPDITYHYLAPELTCRISGNTGQPSAQAFYSKSDHLGAFDQRENQNLLNCQISNELRANGCQEDCNSWHQSHYYDAYTCQQVSHEKTRDPPLFTVPTNERNGTNYDEHQFQSKELMNTEAVSVGSMTEFADNIEESLEQFFPITNPIFSSFKGAKSG